MLSKRLIAVAIALPALVGCLEDTVRYGPVGGLRVRGGTDDGVGGNATCAYPEGTDVTGATCPSWEQVIFPMFNTTYGCTRDGCHGGVNGAANLTMPLDDADQSYLAMAEYKRGERPYIDASNAYLICNIWAQSEQRINPLMPIPIGDEVGLIEGEDLITISNWAACGYPQADVVSTGTGGAGGN